MRVAWDTSKGFRLSSLKWKKASMGSRIWAWYCVKLLKWLFRVAEAVLCAAAPLYQSVARVRKVTTTFAMSAMFSPRGVWHVRGGSFRSGEVVQSPMSRCSGYGQALQGGFKSLLIVRTGVAHWVLLE